MSKKISVLIVILLVVISNIFILSTLKKQNKLEKDFNSKWELLNSKNDSIQAENDRLLNQLVAIQKYNGAWIAGMICLVESDESQRVIELLTYRKLVRELGEEILAEADTIIANNREL